MEILLLLFGFAGAFVVTFLWMWIEPMLFLPFTGQFGEVKFRRGLFWFLCALWMVGGIMSACGA